MRLHLIPALLVPLALAACIAAPAPMTAPSPTELTTPLAPSAVVQTAVRELAVHGFTVTTSDATNGIVVATHPIPQHDLATAKQLLACRWGPDAVGWKMMSGQATLTVTARPAGTGSAVTIVGTTRSAARVGYGMIADPDADSGDCVSSGATEKAIAAALTTQ